MEWITIGIGIITLLQGLSIVAVGMLYAKMDKVVLSDRCEERRRNREKERSHDRDRMKIIERKMNRHIHNGDGAVKYQTFDVG